MIPSDLLSTSFEFQQGAATKWSGRMTGAKPKVAAYWWRREASTGPRAASTAWWPQMQWCFCDAVPTGPAHGRHRQMEQEENGLGQNGTGPVGVLLPISTLLGWGNWQCWKQIRECTQCTKIPPTQAQLHPVWKLQTLTDRDIRKTGITAGKCEVHRDAQRQRQLCINNAAGVGPCN